VGNYLGPLTGELLWPFWVVSGDIPWSSTDRGFFADLPIEEIKKVSLSSKYLKL
jgi:hypothetical protein